MAPSFKYQDKTKDSRLGFWESSVDCLAVGISQNVGKLSHCIGPIDNRYFTSVVVRYYLLCHVVSCWQTTKYDREGEYKMWELHLVYCLCKIKLKFYFCMLLYFIFIKSVQNSKINIPE